MKQLVAATLSALLLLSACSSSKEQEASSSKSAPSTTITVSAAASLHDVLQKLTKQYEKENPSVHIHINSASSGTLAKQLEEGAPADLYISASQKYMDELEKKSIIDKSSRQILLSNKLVLIQPKKSDLSLASIKALKNAKVQHISIGEPSLVPAGEYAKESLTSEKLWTALKSKYVLTKDVTQALSYVETGNAEAGFVYKSDAVTSNKVKISLAIPDSDHQHILYPEAIIKNSKNKKTAKKFVSFLNSKQANKTFSQYGFTPENKGE